MVQALSIKERAWIVAAADDHIRRKMEQHLRDAGFAVVGYGDLKAVPPMGSLSPVLELSPRECEVLEALVTHDRLEEMADALSIAKSTVEHHLRNVMRKLRVRSRHRLIAEAVRHGLLTVEAQAPLALDLGAGLSGPRQLGEYGSRD